jgi:CRISPR-associated protein Cas2
VKKNKPPEGLVQLLKITEKQYARMEYIVGDKTSNILDTDERVVFI